MEKYISVDAGKFATKVGLFNPDGNNVMKYKFRTKLDHGDFRDDNVEKNTYIAEINGEVFKVGNGATTEARLEMTKLSKEHQICALTAIALAANDGDVFHVAIGCPLKEYEVVEKRERYREELLPSGEITVKLKRNSDDEPVSVTFTIESKVVYAESSGILYIDAVRFQGKSVGVIDIGGGTALGNISDNFEIQPAYSVTTENGGNVLITELSQELSAKFGRVDSSYVAKLLKLPPEKRFLSPKNGNKEIEEESRKFIHEFIINYLNRIHRACDAKSWSMDYIDLVFTGGTSEVLAPEIREVFGNGIYVPSHSEFTNAVGFLKKMVARKLNIVLDVKEEFLDVSELKAA
jgi:hypothetical protein